MRNLRFGAATILGSQALFLLSQARGACSECPPVNGTGLAVVYAGLIYCPDCNRRVALAPALKRGTA